MLLKRYQVIQSRIASDMSNKWKTNTGEMTPLISAKKTEEVVIDPEETDSASDGFEYSFSDT